MSKIRVSKKFEEAQALMSNPLFVEIFDKTESFYADQALNAKSNSDALHFRLAYLVIKEIRACLREYISSGKIDNKIAKGLPKAMKDSGYDV